MGIPLPTNQQFQEAMQWQHMKEWLESGVIHVAGYVCFPHNCPISRFLQTMFPLPSEYEWLVSEDMAEVYTHFSYRAHYWLPMWASRIVEKVDALSFTRGFGYPLLSFEVVQLIERKEEFIICSILPEHLKP